MSYHDRFHDSLKNLQLELTQLCFPPPEVIIHQSEVPNADSLSIKYNFDIERSVIADSEKELKKLKDEKEAMLLKKLAIQNVYKNVSKSNMLNEKSTGEFKGSLSIDDGVELIHQVVTCKNLFDSLDDKSSFQENNLISPTIKNECSTNTIFTNTKKPFIDLSEFETPNTVFDMVALKSIDDKAELEALLSTSSNFNESLEIVKTNESNKHEKLGKEVVEPSLLIEVNNSTSNKNVQQSQNLFQYPSMPSFAFNDFKAGQN